MLYPIELRVQKSLRTESKIIAMVREVRKAVTDNAQFHGHLLRGYSASLSPLSFFRSVAR